MDYKQYFFQIYFFSLEFAKSTTCNHYVYIIYYFLTNKCTCPAKILQNLITFINNFLMHTNIKTITLYTVLYVYLKIKPLIKTAVLYSNLYSVLYKTIL